MRSIRVDVDANPALADCGHQYFHCAVCLDEWRELFADITTPRDYARQQISISKDGRRIQAWCVRHACNIAVLTLATDDAGID